MAKELNVPVIVCSQLSRGPESRTGHKPMLSDLRESGSIEQDADIVFIHKPSLYDQNADPEYTEMHVAKHRNGRTGILNFRWIGEQVRFVSANNPASEYQTAAPPQKKPALQEIKTKFDNPNNPTDTSNDKGELVF
jgi:replicative DNA helicase